LQVWNADTSALLRTLSGHSSSVTCVRWTGNNFLISSSQDKTMKVHSLASPTLNHISSRESL
jgi:WD40 repeat protein